MNPQSKPTAKTTPFKSISVTAGADKEALLAQLKAIEQAEKEQQLQAEREQQELEARERESDMALLDEYRAQLGIVTESLRYVTDKNEVATLLRDRQKYEKGIAEIETKYGLSTSGDVAEPTKRKFFGISSTKAILVLIFGFFAFSLLSYVVGKLAAADPTNASAQTILNTFWLRLLINLVLTFATFLVAAGIMYLFFPDAYAIWHTKVKSKNSISTLIESSPSWAVLLFVCFCLGLPIWVFVKLFEVIFV